MGHVSWIPTTKSFGARLALVRQRMGWSTMEEAARECGVPAANWRNWEFQGVNPRNFNEVIEKIVARTDVDAAWLAVGIPSAGSPGMLVMSGQCPDDLSGFDPVTAGSQGSFWDADDYLDLVSLEAQAS